MTRELKYEECGKSRREIDPGGIRERKCLVD